VTGRIIRAEQRAHARPFSPSSFARAEACPRSVGLTMEGGCAARETGFAALFGSVAHEVLAPCVRTGCAPAAIAAVIIEGETVPVTDAMRQMVQAVLSYIAERFPGRAWSSEIRVSAPWGNQFGYVDLITTEAPLMIVDLKTGIHPAPWEQQGLYAMWAALERTHTIEGDGSVLTTVVQPKAPEPIQERRWSYAELRTLRARLLALLDRVRRRDWGEFQDGPHCQFCPHAGYCPRLGAVARDPALADVAPASLVGTGAFSAEELDRTLVMGPALEHRLRQAHAIAKEYLLAGGRLESFKLARARNGRVIMVNRSDPREEVDAGRAFQIALRSSSAFDYARRASSK
jgi:hypothetical protein